MKDTKKKIGVEVRSSDAQVQVIWFWGRRHPKGHVSVEVVRVGLPSIHQVSRQASPGFDTRLAVDGVPCNYPSTYSTESGF